MTDIIKRLRKSHPCRHQDEDDPRTKTTDTCVDSQSMCMCELEDRKEAADEIERLQKQAHYHYENGLKKDVEIERLQAALLDCIEVFGVTTDTQYWKAYDEVIAKARYALQQKESK